MRVIPVTLLPLTLWLLSSAAMADTVYKWVDANGVTHYSDQPNPGAQKLDVQPLNAISTEPVAAPDTSSPLSSAPSYRCELYRPENDEVFLNTSTVSAGLRVTPALGDDTQIALTIDGNRVPSQTPTAMSFVISNVERGTHVAVATITDRAGKTLCVTSPVTFHVRQPSVQAPVRAVRPKF